MSAKKTGIGEKKKKKKSESHLFSRFSFLISYVKRMARDAQAVFDKSC